MRRAFLRIPAFERLESRLVLAAVLWDGGGDGKSWQDASNWSSDSLPASGDDVIISSPLVNYAGPSLSLKSLELSSSTQLSMTSGQLTLDQSFVAKPGAKVSVSGSTTTFRSLTSTMVTDVGLTASGGGHFQLGGQAKLEISIEHLHSVWTATGAGSRIDFDTLVTISRTPLSSDHLILSVLSIDATNGGVVHLPLLRSVDDSPVNFSSAGDGSKISVPSLTTLDNFGFHGFVVRDKGEFYAPLLNSIDDTNLYEISSDARFATGILTSITRSSLHLAQTIDFSSVQNLDYSSVYVSNGAIARFPNVMTYTDAGGGAVREFRADTGGLIDLSQVNELTQTFAGLRGTKLLAYDGGQVLLPAVAKVSDNGVVVGAYGTGSRVDLGALESLSNSTLDLNDTGTVVLSKLKTANASAVSLDKGNLELPSLVTFSGSTLSVSKGVLALPQLDSIDGGSITSLDGANIVLPALKKYTADNQGFGGGSYFKATGAGSRLDLSALVELNGTTGLVKNFQIAATQGGFIDLHNVKRIDVGSVNFLASGSATSIPSTISLTQLGLFHSTLGNGAVKASLEAKDSGRIELGALTSLDKVDLLLNTTSQLDLDKLASFTSGTLTSEGRSVTLGSATVVDVSSFDVRGGAVLSLPMVRKYTADNQGFGGGSYFKATGAGSRLDLSALVELNGTTGLVKNFQIAATQGGFIDLHNVKQIDVGSVNFLASGSATSIPSTISLTQLELFHSTLGNGAVKASLEAKDSGRIELGALTSLDKVDLLLNTTSQLDLDKLASFTSGTLTSEGRSVTLGSATVVDVSSFDVRGGAVLSLPMVRKYTADNQGFGGGSYFKATGAGSRLDLSALVELNGTTGLVKDFQIAAIDGASIDLRKVAQVTAGSVNFLADGAVDGGNIDLASWAIFAPSPGNQSVRASIAVKNRGQIKANSQLSVNDADIIVLNGGTLAVGALLVGKGSTLTGNSLLSSNVTNAGTVYPGDGIGQFQIGGDYVQSADGALVIDVGLNDSTPSVDRLSVTGNATLDGNLQFVRSGGYIPSLGQTFQVIATASRTGQFATVTGNTFGGGVKMQPSYFAKSVNIVAVDDSGPFVTSATLSDARQITINFNEAMDQTTFAATDILVRNPTGVAVNVSQPTWTASTQATFNLTDPILANGIYSLTVGPDVLDLVGNKLDQDRDGIVGEPIEDQFTTTLTLALGDLFVSDLAASSLVAAPGQSLQATWKTHNTTGSTINAVLTEQVYLSDDAVLGNDRLIGTFTFNSTAEVADREVTFIIPTAGMGSGSNVYLITRIDTAGSIAESDETNNALLLATPIVVSQQLSFSLPSNSIREDASAPIRAILSRSGGTAQPLTVAITSSDTTELAVPTSVTIPAGQSSVAVELRSVADQIPDGTQLVTVTATATGLGPANTIVQVIDVDLARLTLDIPVERLTEGSSATATVTRDVVSDAPLVVTINNSNTAQITSPLTVTIPPNQASATFTLTAVENVTPEPPQNVSFTVSATGFRNAGDSLIVDDNDLPQLNLTLDKISIGEAAGNSAVIGTVRRLQATSQALTVSLQASSTLNLRVPLTVTIPANQSSVTFTLSTIDDTLINGSRIVVVTAYGTYPSDGSRIAEGGASAQLTILDDDGASLFVTIDKQFVGEGLNPAATAIVRRTGDKQQALVVNLSSSDTGEATVPAQVTIPAGAESASFPINSIDDKTVDGTKRVTITASATDLTSGSETLSVSDQVVADLIVSEVTVPATAYTDTYAEVSFSIKNVGLIEAAGTITQRVVLSTDPFLGDDTLIGNYSFTGVLQPTSPLNTFTQSVPVRIPQKAVDYWIIVSTDVNDAVIEGIENNNTKVSATPIRVQPAYTATVETSVDVAPAGTRIPLRGGVAQTGSNAPAPFAPVNIDITVRGIKRTISAITDSAGNFATNFIPLSGEAGRYTITAYHPGSEPGPTQDFFTLVGMSANPKSATATVIEDSASQLSSILIENLSEVPLTGLTATATGLPAGVTAAFTLPDDRILPGSSSIPLEYRFTARQVDQTINTNVKVTLRSAEGAKFEIPVSLSIVNKAPVLVAVPNELKAGMLVGTQSTHNFTIRNDGGIPSGSIEILLPDVDWLSVATRTATSLAPGESREITLLLTPSIDMPLTENRGWIVLRDESNSLSSRIDFTFNAISEAEGDVSIEVADELTYYTSGRPLVENARILLRDLSRGTTVLDTTSGTEGSVFRQGLFEGVYELRVFKDKHTEFSANIEIKPGVNNRVEAFIPRQTVTYDWSVSPTTVTSRTAVDIEAVFETNVPAPVIVMYSRQGSGTAFTDGAVLDFSELREIGDTDVVEIKIVNYGLINAQDLALTFGSHPEFEIHPLVSEIAVLSSKSEIVIPVVLRRIAIPGTATGQVSIAASSDCRLVFGLIVWWYWCGTFRTASHSISLIGLPKSLCGPSGGGGGGGATSPINKSQIIEVVHSSDICTRLGLEQFQLLSSEFGLDHSTSRDDSIEVGRSIADSQLSPLIPSERGVCATVTVAVEQIISQDVLAHQARLELRNQTQSSIEAVGVDLRILDSSGSDHTTDFDLLQDELVGLTSTDGFGVLAGNSVGKAKWIITSKIPIVSETTFTLAGSLTYLEDGRTITIPLSPMPIVLLPRPSLNVHYFHQRDVLSDDPFTEVVEPSQPYNLAVMVNNVGYGDARDVSIVSAQPKIIENEKGLLIDFQIIATEVQGQSLSPSLTANFGSIDAGSIAQARWLLTSTLQGQFIDYKATFEQTDVLGGKRLSLIDSVDIHELIHLVTAVGAFDDQKFDYLVNDIPDDNDLPDTLWLSDGSVHTVGLATDLAVDAPVTAFDLEVQLSATISDGWNYFKLPDPGDNKYRITRIVRSDGSEVPIGDNVTGGNAWQTDRTFIERGKRPILENNLHFLDFGGDGRYTLYYTPIDTIGPTIVSIEGPAGYISEAVDTVTVKFSEPIDAASFTRDDLRLTRDGAATNLITNAVNVTRLDETTYQVTGLGVLNTNDGVYSLDINAAGIADTIGNAGTGNSSSQWTKATSTLAIVDFVGVDPLLRNPLPSVTVNFNLPIDPTSFTSDDIELTLNGVAVPLDLASISITPLSSISYRVQGLSTVTQADGQYVLTVRASSVNDTNNSPGIGERVISWTMDATSPSLVNVTGLPSGQTRFSVAGRVDLRFNKAIDPSSFLSDDITLSRNGIQIDTGILRINRLDETKYTIAGLPQLTESDGDYSLSINVPGIEDTAGNPGIGSYTTTWTRDSLAPAPAQNLRFDPKAGTKLNEGTVYGSVDDSAELNLEIFDLTNRVLLATRQSVNGDSAIDVQLSSGGNHRLSIRTIDTAGNAAEAFLDLYFDNQPPSVDRILGLPPSLAGTLPDTVDIVFTKVIDPSSIDLSDFTLVRNNGENLLTSAVSLAKIDGTTYRLAGLSGLIATDGSYRFVVDVTTIQDLSGNAGNEQVVSTWQRDTTVPKGASLRGKIFEDRNRNKIQDADEPPRIGWTVFIDSNRNGTLDLGERFTVTDDAGEYAFDNLPGGTFAIAQLAPNRWTQTFPNPSPAAAGPAGITSGEIIDTFEIDLDTEHLSGITNSPTGGFFTGSGLGYVWQDRDPSTPETIDIYYDFRALNSSPNFIDPAGTVLAEQAFRAWEIASGERLRFHRNETAPAADIIIVGLGDLSAIGGISGTRGTLALGGGDFETVGTQRVIRGGKVWLDSAEAWDYLYANGDQPGTFDFFTVISHEIGHALGLGHADNVPGPDIMDGTYTREKSELSGWDIALVNQLYNQSPAAVADSSAYREATLAAQGITGIHIVSVSPGEELSHLDFGNRFIGQNPTNPFDVNNDGHVSPIDVLLNVNVIIALGVGVSADSLLSDSYNDVNDDGFITPLDLLMTINFVDAHLIEVTDELIANPSQTLTNGIAVSDLASDSSTIDATAPSFVPILSPHAPIGLTLEASRTVGSETLAQDKLTPKATIIPRNMEPARPLFEPALRPTLSEIESNPNSKLNHDLVDAFFESFWREQ